MTTKHTPGPWVFSQDAGWYIRAEGVSLMGNETYYPWNPENIADWQLIAAAPDLLEALKALSCTARTFRNVPQEKQCWTPIDDEALEAAFNAISKATGETS